MTSVTRHTSSPSQIKSFTLLETRDTLRASLQKVIQDARLESKTTILPLSISQRSELAARGVKPGTFDTVVLGESPFVRSAHRIHPAS